MNHGVLDAGIGLMPGAPVEVNRGAFEALFSDSRLGRALRARADVTFGTQTWEFQAHDVEIGFTYEGGAIVDDGSGPTDRDDLGRIYTPSTKPGHRLPHAWLEHDGRRLSTHDLAGAHGGFALITGPGGHAWAEAAATAADKTGVSITVADIGGEEYRDPDGTWARLRQIGDDGAILVRPDNHVAWRSPGFAPDPAGALTDAISSVLGR
jgi:2,4-dichlorophenol 6-monooxygenase